jgi:hypothetical protein
MLIPLTNADDLPWKLGRRLPRDYEKKANIAEMEACARALDIDLTVKWVPDERTCWGDFDHPAAEMPDPMAVVAAEFEKMCQRFPLIAVDPGRVDGDRTAVMKYWLDEGDNIHIEPIPARDLYADLRQAAKRNPSYKAFHREAEQMRLNDEMNAMADRISCVPPGTVAQTALEVLQAQDARRMRLRDELCGVTDIMRGQSLAAFDHCEAEQMRPRICCTDCGVFQGELHHESCTTVRAATLRAQEAVGFQYPRTQPWWQQ